MFSVRQIDGRKVWKRLGEITRAEALKADAEVKKKVDSGEIRQEVSERAMTFFQLCDWYLGHPDVLLGKKNHQKMIMGHRLPGMDAHYILQVKSLLHEAMAQFTAYRYNGKKPKTEVPKLIEPPTLLLPSANDGSSVKKTAKKRIECENIIF